MPKIDKKLHSDRVDLNNHTGLKESYITGLKWDDISLNSKLIFILPPGIQ